MLPVAGAALHDPVDGVAETNTTSEGKVSVLAGKRYEYGSQDGPKNVARFEYPLQPAADSSGNVYVLDGNRIRKITPAGDVSTVAGHTPAVVDGVWETPEFESGDLAADPGGNLYFTDYTGTRTGAVIRKVVQTSGSVTSTTSVSTTTIDPSMTSTTTTASITTTSTATTVPEASGVLTARIVREPNSAVGAPVYTVNLRLAGVVSGASYEFVVPSGHVPEPLPPDPATHRYPRTAVDGVVEWEYSLTKSRGVFSAQVFSAGGSFALSSVEVK